MNDTSSNKPRVKADSHLERASQRNNFFLREKRGSIQGLGLFCETAKDLDSPPLLGHEPCVSH